MRGVLDTLELLEALHDAGKTTPLDRIKRIIVFIVNSLSSPPTNWDESEAPPGTLDILLKATGVPIDHYSYEAVEQLKDTAARWANMRVIRNSAAMAANKDPAVAAAVRGPNAEIYAVDVSFARLKDTTERAYLNLQPTSFVLPDEAVDRLRAAAGTIIQSIAGLPAAAEGPRGARRGSARGCKGAAGGARSPVARRVGAGCISARKSNGHRVGCPSSRSWRPARQTRRRYSPVRVSISILSPVVTNSGTWHLEAAGELRGLHHLARRVALDGGLGVGDFADDGVRQLDRDRLAVVERELAGEAVLEVVERVAHVLLLDLVLVELAVHEHVHRVGEVRVRHFLLSSWITSNFSSAR